VASAAPEIVVDAGHETPGDAAPEVEPEPRPVETKPGKTEPDLTSLEDEMARLLDELAGDNRR
jgi:hypothetical protein